MNRTTPTWRFRRSDQPGLPTMWGGPACREAARRGEAAPSLGVYTQVQDGVAVPAAFARG
jgi:hypothetical protein